MSVKWIKITTSMFEDEKIDFIESLPEADAILIIWIKLLTLAGKCNANGFIFLTEKIPYTEEMLSHKFRRPASIVKLALETFKRLEMIEINDEGYLKITNWEKHQNIEGLDKIREQTRKRVARYREKQKLLQDNSDSNVTCNVTVTQSNAIEIEEELDIDIDKEEEEEEDNILSTSPAPPKPAQPMKPVEVIFNHWNSKGIIKHRKITDKLKRAINNALKDYSQDEICTAIDNYAIILADDKYYWTYKWGLGEFISRGLDKFLDFEVAANNYMKDKNRTEPQSWDKLRRLYQKYEAEENLERSSYL